MPLTALVPVCVRSVIARNRLVMPHISRVIACVRLAHSRIRLLIACDQPVMSRISHVTDMVMACPDEITQVFRA